MLIVLTGVSVRPCVMLHTGLTDAEDWYDWSEQGWYNYSVLRSGLDAFVHGELHWLKP
jgi:hypothetical protein